MEKLWEKLNSHLEMYVASVFLVLFTILTIIQIIARYVFSFPLDWSEELSRFAFIWFVFLSTSYAVKHQAHVRLTVIVNMLPKLAKKIVQIIALLFLLAFFGFVFYNSFELTEFVYQSKQLSAANRLPMYLVYLSLPVGIGLATLRVIQLIIKTIKGEKIDHVN